MIPIQRLVNRIRWDREFGTAYFEIGYLDHTVKKIIRIPFTKIHLQQGNQFSFQLEDETGEMLVIPLHRIRRVFRDGVLIWSWDSWLYPRISLTNARQRGNGTRRKRTQGS